MNFLKSFSFVCAASHRTLVGAGLLAGGFIAGAADVRAAIFKNGFVDHAICCAAGGPLSFDGTAVRGGGVTPPTFAGSEPAGGVHGAQFQAVATESAEAAAPAGPPKEVDGYLQLEFARLSEFKIEAPAYDPAVKPETALAAVEKQIPEAIKQLDGRRAQLTGFMLPVKMEGQLVSQFLLMRDQMMCCYGVVPRMNDWVVVYTAKPVRFTPDVPVSFRGKLQVKAMQEQGFITGIYLLEEAVPGK